MGIRGLNSFFDQNNEISPDRHKLRNTRLIIDGCNLLYYLYSDLDVVYGGEYEKFAQKLRNFFHNFRKCNIFPIVILDGGDDPTDRKLPVLLSRMKDRIKTALKISKLGKMNGYLLPFLCTTILIEVLKDEGVVVLQSEFEADEEIVAIANYYQCPILSNDSDFYLFDLRGGFVRLDSLHWTPCYEPEEPQPFLPCTIYFIDNFLKHFPGISKEVLPLFGTIMGNDYVRPETFNNFFGTIRLPKYQMKRFKVTGRHTRMVGLLSWMEDKTYEEVLEQLIGCVNEDSREYVLKITQEAVEGYRNVKSILLGYLVKPDRAEPSMVNPKAISMEKNVLPTWMMYKIHQAELTTSVLDIACNRRVRLSPLITEPTTPSSHKCAAKIRLAVYKLILTIDGFKDCSVKEYDHKNWNLSHHLVDVIHQNPAEEKIPNLFVLPNLNYELRRFYLVSNLESLDLDLSYFPDNLQLPILVLNFFARNTALPLSEEFVSALLVCMIVLGIVRPLRYRNILNLRVTLKEVNVADTGFSKFFHKPRNSNARVFMPDIVHRFSEYQTCFRQAYSLNQLLGEPLPRPIVSECLSGTFIYNLTVVMRNKSVDLFISEHLGRGSSLDKFYAFTKRFITDHLRDVPFQTRWAKSPPKPRGERNQKRTSYQHSGGNRFELLNQNQM